MKFTYNTKVKSVNCFFSGFKGRVISFQNFADGGVKESLGLGSMEYEVEGSFKDGRIERRWFKEKELRLLWFGRW